MELCASFAALVGIVLMIQWRKELILIPPMSNSGAEVVVAVPLWHSNAVGHTCWSQRLHSSKHVGVIPHLFGAIEVSPRRLCPAFGSSWRTGQSGEREYVQRLECSVHCGAGNVKARSFSHLKVKGTVCSEEISNWMQGEKPLSEGSEAL